MLKKNKNKEKHCYNEDLLDKQKMMMSHTIHNPTYTHTDAILKADLKPF